MPRSEISQTVKLLALVSAIKPESFDVFPPYGPVVFDRFESSALNPQPLPPSGQVVAGAIMMSNHMARLAIEADLRGEDPAVWVSEVIDDWCGTPWPRKWPRPGPPPEQEGPSPDPWAVSVARAAGAVVFASVAARLGAGELSDTLARGSEKLAEVAVQGL